LDYNRNSIGINPAKAGQDHAKTKIIFGIILIQTLVLYLRASLNPAKARHHAGAWQTTPIYKYKISLDYFIPRFGITEIPKTDNR